MCPCWVGEASTLIGGVLAPWVRHPVSFLPRSAITGSRECASFPSLNSNKFLSAGTLLTGLLVVTDNSQFSRPLSTPGLLFVLFFCSTNGVKHDLSVVLIGIPLIPSEGSCLLHIELSSFVNYLLEILSFFCFEFFLLLIYKSHIIILYHVYVYNI